MTTAVIIGAGLGGLFTGAILSKEGFQVTVLEKNKIIGGGLQTFHCFGEAFDTGMHVVGGMENDGNIFKICQYLGIADRVSLRPVDRACSDMLYFAEDKTAYILRNGKRGFVDSLSTYFPEERNNIEAYVSAMFDIANGIDLYNLRPSRETLPLLSDLTLMPANGFIAKYVSDRRLRSVLAYINPFYGGRENETPAYIHALINVLYINGTMRFVDGSSRFADLLASVITDNGGRVIADDGVEWVEINDRYVDFVRTKSGRQCVGDFYISAIHPCTLFKLTDEKSFPKSYRDRLNTIPNSYSAFSLYIKMKEGTFPYINHSEYYMTRYDDIWSFGDKNKSWPLGFMMMTPPVTGQGRYSRKVLVTAPMLFDEVRRWESTSVGRRGKDYEQWKREKAQLLLNMIEDIHPGFSEAVDKVNASSPLTIRDFYGVKEGAISGFSKDCRNIAYSQVPVVTKVKNLLLTGQNNRLHGFCGVPLTAINTCEAILGQNYIINRINGHE